MGKIIELQENFNEKNQFNLPYERKTLNRDWGNNRLRINSGINGKNYNEFISVAYNIEKGKKRKCIPIWIIISY